MAVFRSKCWSLVSALLLLSPQPSVAAEVDVGYDVYAAAQAMINLASHSWEYGTAAEALLELYNPDLSVFGSNPFPGGKVPSANPSTLALEYAKQFIYTQGAVLVPDSAVGDPASLGVSAILLGQSDGTYLDAANRQASYILNQAPRYANGAISHRPDVAELWADNMAMSFPFLAYLAVQTNNASLMSTTVAQCGLQRDVLKTSQNLNWQHIIGPQSQDTGLWSTGNGWAGYGMVRVLHTLQKWSGSSSMTSQAGQLKTWIQEILDGAMLSGLDGGLLHNYLNDASWFGEVSGTAMLTAVAYRMAVNDPGMFPQKYITWADTNRKSLAQYQGSDGIFSPTVNPYNWLDRTKYTSGSPEGQAFTVYLYTAYRDCVGAGVCSPPASTASTISAGGIGPFETLIRLDAPLTIAEMPAPTGSACDSPQSCDANGCKGTFNGLTKYPTCTAGELAGCQCTVTPTTCGAHQSCDLNGCAGAFNGLSQYPQCTGNFVGCNCTATATTCGAHQSCDLNGCAGAFNGLAQYPQCTGNFVGCNCTATPTTCGAHQSCDLNGCAGAFNGLSQYPQCTGNFVGCNCTATSTTCGAHQSCDLNGCAGAFNGLAPYAQCTGNFVGCNCTATANTCGAHQSCDLNGCAGAFNGLETLPQCTGNFVGCNCTATATTCGAHQSCDLNGCAGAFNGIETFPQCTGNFVGCNCSATANACGERQSCDLNGCAGAFKVSEPYAKCTGNFQDCDCSATANTCGPRQSCDLNGCAGAFNGKTPYPSCTKNFLGCECAATGNTCGTPQSCDLNECAGQFNLNDGKAYCNTNFLGCQCKPTANTCGAPQSCDLDNCAGAFPGSTRYPQCTNFFNGCQCTATANTCGSPQDCGLNGCAGAFDLSNGKAYCTQNFVGCECKANPGTCGAPQSCDLNNCAGAFQGLATYPVCTNFFKGCTCQATSKTCGSKQSCDLNGCAGAYDSSGVARCEGNFKGCACNPTSNTCGLPQSCDLNGCNGAFTGPTEPATCQGKFAGCPCTPTSNTCGGVGGCAANGCNGVVTSSGSAVCTGDRFGCPCDPSWSPPPSPTTDTPTPTPTAPSLPPLVSPWFCVGVSESDDCAFGGCTRSFGLGARNMNAGTMWTGHDNGVGHPSQDLCGASLDGVPVSCQGDITQQCAGYGVATFNGRTCRTYCPGAGDPEYCFNLADISGFGHSESLSLVLVCDRALS